jgi:ribosomal protein S27E
MTVNVKIVFEHSQNNVTSDCPACSSTIRNTTQKWAPVCKGFTIAVSKNS